jgi:HK97 family phage portal protein
MNLNPFSFLKKKEKRSVTLEPVDAFGLPYLANSQNVTSQLAALQLSTVYRCVEVISDAMGSQSWEIMEYLDKLGWVANPFNQFSYLINQEPSPNISRYMFMKTLAAKVLLEGNGYAIIRRNFRGDPIRLDLVTGSTTMYLKPDRNVYYKVKDQQTQEEEIVESENMIHVLNFSYNGYFGVSTLTHATNTMDLATSAEASAKGFFSSGANMSGILMAEGKLKADQADAIKAAWAEAFNVTDGTPGGIAVMEAGLKFEPVTVNPKDAQMLETRQFNVLEICRFFGCPPSKVFDNSNLTYSNVEAYQLGFITDTISPLDSKFENEFNRKLFRPSQRSRLRVDLNINELLRANLDAKANYVSKMFQCGGYTVNEVRKETRQPLSPDPNAEKPMIQVNMMPIDKIGMKEKPINNNLKSKTNGKGTEGSDE